jgi:hypothetical protein
MFRRRRALEQRDPVVETEIQSLIRIISSAFGTTLHKFRLRAFYGNHDHRGFHSKFSIIQMSPPCGRKRSNKTHRPSGDQTG